MTTKSRHKVKVHRGMEGIETRSICGLSYLAPLSTYGIGPFTSYDWKKITCRKCKAERHNYG